MTRRLYSAISAFSQPEKDPIVCRHVRSKGAGVVYGDRVRWENGFSPTAVFWCLHTAEPVGPDDQLVHPHLCIPGRECFCGTTNS